MPSDPLNLEPKNGDFVDYIESLQASSQKNLDGITPPMTADHHIGLPPNADGRADDGISLKDLIAAFRRKTGMPKASPQDSSREAALARMESSANPNAPEPVIAKPKKLDPAAKFAVSICWMLGFMGTAIGVKGAIVPLVFGCAPFFTRQIESALADVDPGLIEAAQSMGLDNKDIIFRVYLKESIAGIARGTTITIISLIGLTAMAGAIGAGGLGNFAIMYGHQRNMPDITYTTVVVLVIIVTVVQLIGNYIAKKNTH